jgi:hypothetical protein
VAPPDTNPKDSSPSSFREVGNDVIQVVVAYVKQETLGPLRALERFLIFGILGFAAIALGSVLLLIAILRILQEETGAFHGNLSWVPYLIVSVIGTAVIVIAAWRVTSGPAARRLPSPEERAS